MTCRLNQEICGLVPTNKGRLPDFDRIERFPVNLRHWLGGVEMKSPVPHKAFIQDVENSPPRLIALNGIQLCQN